MTRAYPDARLVWWDGALVARDAVRIDPLAHGLHYGTSAFEGIRAYETPDGVAIFRLRDHIDRLAASAAVFGPSLPFDAATLERACEDVIAANGLRDAYLRPLAMLDASGLSVAVRQHGFHVLVAAWSWGPYLGAAALEHGIRVGFVPTRKTASDMVPARAKVSGNYVNGAIAIAQAIASGHDEALLVNDRGAIAEGTGENVFLVRDGRLLTPRAEDDILPGITRASVITIARDLGIACEERTLDREDVLAADEIFLTGTAAEVTPVRALDGASVGDGRPGPVTRAIQRAYLDAVRGRDGDRYAAWRHPVPEAAAVAQ